MTAAPTDAKAPSPLLKLALELGPLVLFFLVNGRTDIFTATAAFMVAASVAFVLLWRIERKLPIMPLVNIAIVLVFGGLTLILKDETFIKMKPTLVYGLLAALLIGGTLTGRQPLKLVMGAAIELREVGWAILTRRWVVFFLVMAAINEAVWRTLTTDQWVAFKTFGALPLALVFALAQTPTILRYQTKTEDQQS